MGWCGGLGSVRGKGRGRHASLTDNEQKPGGPRVAEEGGRQPGERGWGARGDALALPPHQEDRPG